MPERLRKAGPSYLVESLSLSYSPISIFPYPRYHLCSLITRFAPTSPLFFFLYLSSNLPLVHFSTIPFFHFFCLPQFAFVLHHFFILSISSFPIPLRISTFPHNSSTSYHVINLKPTLKIPKSPCFKHPSSQLLYSIELLCHLHFGFLKSSFLPFAGTLPISPVTRNPTFSLVHGSTTQLLLYILPTRYSFIFIFEKKNPSPISSLLLQIGTLSPS